MAANQLTYRAVCYARAIVLAKLTSYCERKSGKLPSTQTINRWLSKAWDDAYFRVKREHPGGMILWDIHFRRQAWQRKLERLFADPQMLRPGLITTVEELVAIQHRNAITHPDTHGRAFKKYVQEAWRRASDQNFKDTFPIPYEREIVLDMIKTNVRKRLSDDATMIDTHPRGHCKTFQLSLDL